MLTKQELLQPLASLRTDEVVVTTMGVVRPWSKFSDSPLDFASADSAMGHVADLALGIALAQPQRRVICLNGDGSLLMTLGSLATVVEAGARNLILFTVENRTYEITGNQAIAGAGRVDFAGLARAAGFAGTYAFDDPGRYARALPEDSGGTRSGVCGRASQTRLRGSAVPQPGRGSTVSAALAGRVGPPVERGSARVSGYLFSLPVGLARISQCAMERRLLLTGAKPVQQLSLRLVAARADHGGNDMV